MTTSCSTIPYTLPWDDAPVDLSFIFEDEKPAGRHGFLRVKHDKMVFEDGTIARFWGTNFNGAHNFPPHAYSELVARRLAKFGVNLVRFHQLDADWPAPNIFQFARGPRIETTRAFDPASMDRLDYLIHCLKAEGIYIYMDLLTYRKFRGGDGVQAADRLPFAARPYSNFNARLIELQKEFSAQLWTHKNPYTGLMYKDDPAIAMTGITNENQVFEFMKNLEEPYRSQLAERYALWRKERGLAPADDPAALYIEDKPTLEFLVEVQLAYFRTMYKHLRDIGVRVPISGTNWQKGGMATLAGNAEMDFADSHSYWYDFTWKNADKRFRNDSMLGDRGAFFVKLTGMQLHDKPFFISEWDDPWPNEWRAECPLLMAAVMCLQGWSGAAIHTYRYDCRPNVDQIAAPITSDALAGVAHRAGIFETFNDPAKFGLFYHAALMVRRGDVREHTDATEVALSDILHPDGGAGKKGIIKVRDIATLFGAPEVCKLAMRLPGAKSGGGREIPAGQLIVPADASELTSETGELYRNIARKYGFIDTSRTKAVYGFLGAAGTVNLRGLTVRALSDFAVIAISSLSETGLSSADNMLLTAVGRAENTGAEYNAERTVQLKLGHGPILAQVIDADIELETVTAGLQVWSVSTQGALIGQIPAHWEGGRLRFRIGPTWPSIYYLIQKV